MLVKSVKLRSVEVGESSKVFQAGNKGNLRFCSRHWKVANRERSIIEFGGKLLFFMFSFWFLLAPLISLCYNLYLRYLGNSWCSLVWPFYTLTSNTPMSHQSCSSPHYLTFLLSFLLMLSLNHSSRISSSGICFHIALILLQEFFIYILGRGSWYIANIRLSFSWDFFLLKLFTFSIFPQPCHSLSVEQTSNMPLLHSLSCHPADPFLYYEKYSSFNWNVY